MSHKDHEFRWNEEQECGEYYNDLLKEWFPIDFTDKENQRWFIERLQE